MRIPDVLALWMPGMPAPPALSVGLTDRVRLASIPELPGSGHARPPTPLSARHSRVHQNARLPGIPEVPSRNVGARS